MIRRTIEIFPTEEQESYIKTAIGVYRYVYNWGIDICKQNYQNGNKLIKKSDLFKRFSEERKTSEIFQKIDLHTGRSALIRLYNSYIRFFKRKGGYPKYKSRKRSKQSISVRNDDNAFYFRGTKVKIPGLKSLVECKNHPIPTSGVHFYAPTIIFDRYRYWLSVSYEEDRMEIDEEHNDLSIGIDLGFRKNIQLSTGEVYNYPDLHKLDKRRRKLQRNLDRRRVRKIRESKSTRTKYEDLPTSNAELKVRYQLYKTQQRMNFIRHSFEHQTTSEIVKKNPSRIVVEDLHIIGILSLTSMRKQHAHSGISFTNILRQLEYKSDNRGIEFVKAPRQFPSSQICSRCGNRHKPYANEIFTCPYCGYVIDRDLNAAINLSRVGM